MKEPSEHEFSGGSTSRSLLNEARVADAKAWERLVRLYTPLVASWCRRWGVSQQDIVDVLQEVFAAVFSHLDRFRKDRPGDTFRGWLMTIARSKAMDHFNRRNREPAGVGGTEASMRMKDIRDPGTDANIVIEITDADDDIVVSDVLRRALDSIKDEFHERTWLAFWKVVVEGRAASDVAADMDIKPGTVRVAKSRVLLRLRRELGDSG